MMGLSSIEAGARMKETTIFSSAGGLHTPNSTSAGGAKAAVAQAASWCSDDQHVDFPHHPAGKETSPCCLQAQRCLLIQGFCCTKSLYLAACQKSPCCSLDAYSRPAFTVLLLLRLETRPEAIQLCGDISKGAKGVVDTQGQLVERVGARSWFEASVQELGEERHVGYSSC
jgi:hypothetical protein